MKLITRRTVLALALAASSAGALAQNKVNLGVAIPAATHGFTGGIVWWANEAKKELEKKYPDLKITVKTAANAGEQANQLQDLMTVTKINALVIFPFESAALRWSRLRHVHTASPSLSSSWMVDHHTSSVASAHAGGLGSTTCCSSS